MARKKKEITKIEPQKLTAESLFGGCITLGKLRVVFPEKQARILFAKITEGYGKFSGKEAETVTLAMPKDSRRIAEITAILNEEGT